MFAGRERAQREIEVKTRRHRDHHGVDRRVVDRRLVVAVAAGAAEPAAVVVGLRTLAAGVERNDVGAQRDRR